MKAYVIDYDAAGHRRPWLAWLGEKPTDTFVDNDLHLVINDEQTKVNQDAEGIALFHWSYINGAVLRALSGRYTDLIIIAISGDGIENGPGGERCYCVKRPVGKQEDDVFGLRLKEFVEKIQTTRIPDFTLLEPSGSSETFALRLLCEAWEQVEVKKEQELNGIVIHSPGSDAKKWFDPFGTGPSEDNADKIAALMGEAEERASAVLLAVVTNGDMAGRIGEFLRPKPEGSRGAGTDGTSKPVLP